MSYIYFNLLKTCIAIILVFLIDLVIERFAVRKISSQKKSKKIRLIVRNILIISLVIFLAKIWIEGFGHFLAFVGFISAALTISQKENILNLTGGFIIMWRDAFAEGDYVAIKEFEGIVDNLGIFYFTLEEVPWGDITSKSGKMIKVPNSYISLYPFTIYAFENFYILERKYVFKFSSDKDKLTAFADRLRLELREHIIQLSEHYKGEVQREYKKLISKQKYSQIDCKIKIKQGKPSGYALIISGHVPYKNTKEIIALIEDAISDFMKTEKMELDDS